MKHIKEEISSGDKLFTGENLFNLFKVIYIAIVFRLMIKTT
jgi:hypothetical protein